MALADGLARIMESRGMTTRDVLDRLGERRDRATVYRLLAGQTANPRLDTILTLCAAMETTPNELLDQSDIFPERPRSADQWDLRLRVAFRRLQALPPEAKALAITQTLMLLETWERATQGQPLDDLADRVSAEC